MKLVDALTVPIVWHYGKQQSAITTNSDSARFPKRKRRTSPKIRTTQQKHISAFCQAMVMVQTRRGDLILVSPKGFPGKLMGYSAARGIQDIKRSLPFRITVANFTGKKNIISKHQVVWMAEGPPRPILATNQPLEKCRK